MHDNELHLFDLYKEERKLKYEIGKSHIYEEQFQFEMSGEQDEFRIVFWKTSVLKSTPITIYYDVHLISVGGEFEKIKKVKVEHQELRKFGYCSGELFSYQMTGFTIEINFIDSGIFHQINSIFHLFLVDLQIQKEFVVFNFTH